MLTTSIKTMEISLTLSGQRNSELVIKRNWFTGSFEYFVEGKSYTIKSALDISTHYSFSLKKTYEFELRGHEFHSIRIEHTRPLFFAGFRPHEYVFFVNGELNKTYKGY